MATEDASQWSPGDSRMIDGCSKNIDTEVKNIFSPIILSNSPYSNASSASYGTPEHTRANGDVYYQDFKNYSSGSCFSGAENGTFPTSSEMLLARPNSSGPSVFLRDFSRDGRYNENWTCFNMLYMFLIKYYLLIISTLG